MTEIICPAGLPIGSSRDGSPGCLCRIEENVLSERSDPNSLTQLCAHRYDRCNTYRMDRDRDRIRQRKGRLLDDGLFINEHEPDRSK